MPASTPDPNYARLEQLRRALPEVISNHIAQLDAGTVQESKMAELGHLIRLSLQSGVSDQVFPDDLRAVVPFVTLMMKVLADPSLKNLSSATIDHLVLLFRFVRRRSPPAFRCLFRDLLMAVTELTNYSKANAARASFQAGFPVRLLLLPGFLHFLTCSASSCQTLTDGAAFCPLHPCSSLILIDISSAARLELFHAAVITIVGHLSSDSLFIGDLLSKLPSLLADQIGAFSPDIQEAAAFVLVQYGRATPSPASFPAFLQLLELIATDCFRTRFLEGQVANLIGILLEQIDGDHVRPISMHLLVRLRSALLYAQTPSLRDSLVAFTLDLFRRNPFLRLQLHILQEVVARPPLFLLLSPLFTQVLSSLPPAFLSRSLALNPDPTLSEQQRRPPDHFINKACWAFFHELVVHALRCPPSAFPDFGDSTRDAFVAFVAVFSCFVRFPDHGLLGQLSGLMKDWLTAIAFYCEVDSAASYDQSGTDTAAALLHDAFDLLAASFRFLPVDLFTLLHPPCLGLITIPFSSSFSTDPLRSRSLTAWCNLPPSPDDQIEIPLLIKLLPNALAHLPVLLYRIAPTAARRHDHVTRLLHQLHGMELDSQQKQSVADSVGRLFCLLSDSCTLHDSLVTCRVCDASGASPKEAAHRPSWEIAAPFLPLLDPSESVTVRAAMAASLFRCLCHADPATLPAPRLRSLTLDLLFDPSGQVRQVTARHLHLLVAGPPVLLLFGPGPAPARPNPLLHAVRCLVELLVEANLRHGDMDMFRDVVLALASVAKTLTGTAQAVIVVVLIQQMLQDDVGLRALAYQQVGEIARHAGVIPAQLVRHPYVLETLLLWMPERRLVCDEVCEAFLDQSVAEFLGEILPGVLPALILKHAEAALQEVAARLGVSVRAMVMERIAPVLLRILIDEDPDDNQAAAAIAFLADRLIPAFRFSELLNQSKSLLLESLVDAMGLPGQYVSAMYALRILVLADAGSGFGDYRAEQVADDAQVARFCSDYFLMISDYLYGFIHGTYPPPRRLQALRSLACLAQLVGDRIAKFASKLLAMLRRALERPGPESVGLEALKVLGGFIDALKVEQLGICLSQLIVTLLSCWHACAGSAIRPQVVLLLDRLLIGRRDQLAAYFSDVPIIPDDDSLRHIKQSVEAVIGNCTVTKKLDNLLRLLDHASANVRHMALSQLKMILRHHEGDVQRLIASNAGQLQRLVIALMHRCSDPCQETRLECAECIGVLGAIDPAQVGDLSISQDPITIGNYDDFAAILCVDYLVKAIRSLPPSDQNRSMFALQEILRWAGCRPRTPDLARDAVLPLGDADRRGVAFWARIPSELRDLVSPCLLSNLFIPPRTPSPFDGTVIWRPEISYERWLAEWTRLLISAATSPAQPIFAACQGAVVSDLATAKFLLPHLVIEALRSGSTAAIAQVRAEVLTVLEEAMGSTPRPPQSMLQTVFDLVDILRLSAHYALNGPSPCLLRRAFQYADCAADPVVAFLDSIPHRTLSRAAHAAGAHARALRHFDLYARQSASARLFSADLQFLQALFADLDDFDGLQSIPRLRTEPATPAEQGRDFESLGQWNMALVCYQEECRAHAEDDSRHLDLVQTLWRLGQYETCVAHSRRVVEASSSAAVPARVIALGLEAAWRLSDWPSLSWLADHHPDQGAFEVGVGRLLLAWQAGQYGEVEAGLRQVRLGVMTKLAAAAQESYSRSYPLWVQLQTLQCLATALGHVTGRTPWDWYRAVANMQPKFAVRESQLSLLRVIFEGCGWAEMAGRCWLRLAREARCAGELEQAAFAVLRAQRYQIRNSGLEQAKLLRAQGLLHQALSVLEEYSHIGTGVGTERHMELCHMTCLIGEYMQASSSRLSDSVLSCYRRAITQFPDSGRAHYLWASYTDLLLNSVLSDSDLPEKKRRLQVLQHVPDIIQNYLSAVRSAPSYVFETLPRVLTLFCQHADTLAPNKTALRSSTQWIHEAADVVPAHVWFTVLSLILSRLQTENSAIQQFLQTVIAKVIVAHPRQATWLVITVHHFKNERRRGMIKKIFALVQKRLPSPAIEELLLAEKLLRLLIDLCTTPVAQDAKTMAVPAALRRYLRSTKPCLIIPLQATLTVAIPDRIDDDQDLSMATINADLKPFAEEPAMLQAIDDAVLVLNSKEKPRKACFRDSNGGKHCFLCKIEGEGDMRKNSRVMDFAAVVNRLFRCSSEARQRRLRLRTFAVLPLREDCGIIEWIPETINFRAIVDLYQRKFPLRWRDAMKYYTEHGNDPVGRLQYLVAQCPAVLHRFFLDKFPEPNSWYESRLIYTRAWASWAIVGHILGLGDRHSENILIDQSNGEAIHVDFDCLFDRGLNLKTPEVVPFRLTQNALDGMGITKQEGVFRSCCHLVLTLLRTHQETVKNCLETFVHDPLVEWNGAGSAVSARKAMTDIKRRLAGQMSDSTLAVSVEGYVDHLIQQATSPDNLGRMFVGWMPWL